MRLDGASPEAIRQAAQVLARGDLLGLPTETVYGLAADADNADAVRHIFATKGRPADHPLIVHVAEARDAEAYASEVPAFAQRLMAAFWPGPLTLILPRRAERAAVAAGGQASVGLRCPSHPVAQAVLREAKALGVQGVAAPSANRFGRVSPTTAAHVQQEFPALCVMDGGACEVGIESTIVDCTRGAPVLLRPGVLTPAQLSHACGVDVIDTHSAQTASLAAPAPRASGTLESHYAPQALVRLLSMAAMQAALPTMGTDRRVAVWSTQAPSPLPPSMPWRAMPTDPRVCAHDLFAVLRAFDAQGVDEIWVEQPPEGAAWDGVRDRLTRAAA
jgi:L-threonylcarbamoyladenylate synthase